MSDNPNVIPQSERYAGLKETLLGYVEQLTAARKIDAVVAQQPLPFASLVLPWIAEKDAASEDLQWVPARKKEIERLGFDGDTANKKLEEILAADKHLRECCPGDFSFGSLS
jgi:hypothetical protein